MSQKAGSKYSESSTNEHKSANEGKQISHFLLFWGFIFTTLLSGINNLNNMLFSKGFFK